MRNSRIEIDGGLRLSLDDGIVAQHFFRQCERQALAQQHESRHRVVVASRRPVATTPRAPHVGAVRPAVSPMRDSRASVERR